MPLPLPGLLGYEDAGVVEKAGPSVDSVAPGDYVAMGWPFCGTCRYCLAGEPRYCERGLEALCGGHRLLGPDAGASAYTREDGSPLSGHFFCQSSFATHSIALASQVVKVDNDVPLELLGPYPLSSLGPLEVPARSPPRTLSSFSPRH